MPYSIVASGGTLYRMDTAGAATALTLPAGVTLSSTRRARMAVSGRNIVIVNGPLRSLFVDPDSTVRPLQLQPPSSAPVLAAGAAGGLTGTFRCKYTFIIKDSVGNLISESDFSPISAAVTITSKLIAVSGVQVSPDTAVTGRRMYRTATSGSTYFQWLDLDDNALTSFSDDLSDASLNLLAAPTELGVGPGMIPGTFMTLITEWKGRLWGVGDQAIDDLRGSGAGLLYSWPTKNVISIPPVGVDQYGITGLMARRDELVVTRRQHIWKVIGTDFTDFVPIKLQQGEKGGKGCVAPDSALVIDDTCYFLGMDGVYTYGAEGIKSISNADSQTGRHGVRAWFTKDATFNRSQFLNAFAVYNAKYHGYELHLAAAGSTNIDRWVSYDIATKQWHGPHQTAEFTPTFGASIIDSTDQVVPVLLSGNGFIYQQNQATFLDGTSAIVMKIQGKFHDAEAPDVEHYWGELSLISKIQALPGNLQIQVRIGGLDAGLTSEQTLGIDQTLGRQRQVRLGTGRLLNLTFQDDTPSQGSELFGYEVPYFEIGRR